MNAVARLVDMRGQPLMSADTSYAGASTLNPDVYSWAPALRSPDVDILPEWSTIVSRTRDLVRNNGVASGAVQTHLDNVIGSGLRLMAKPDWRALGQTAEWSEEWSRKVEALWRAWADDPDFHCDATRQMNFNGLLGLAYRSFLLSSEILATSEWRPTPGRYSTCLNVLQPERLSNPNYLADSFKLRAGVEKDEYGAPVAYWIRDAHESDGQFWDAPVYQWKRIPKATPWGRRNIFHVFEIEQGGQSRGVSGFVATLVKARMLDNWQKVTLQSAVVNAMYAAVIESSLDSATIGRVMGNNPTDALLEEYCKKQATFHKEKTVQFDGVKVPHLLPGEKLNFMSAEHPTASYEKFEQASLRHMAAGLNMSYEQLSRDYSQVNYSSARASMLETWRFFMGRRHNIVGARFAGPIYANWLEEAIDRGEIELPKGAPDFYTAKAAWTRCAWIGGARGYVDPEKEMRAAQIEYDMGLTTLEELSALQGRDWEETLEQRAREKEKMKLLGLEPKDLAPQVALKAAPAPDQNAGTDNAQGNNP